MDKYVYCNILANNNGSSIKKLGLNEYVFRQNNGPKHTSNYLKKYFQNKNIKILYSQSESPDLNPIEHLWNHIKKELKNYKSNNIEDLKYNISKIWNSIDVKITQNLVDSMPNRIIEVLRNKGGNTKY